jgi:hypothetical protein
MKTNDYPLESTFGHDGVTLIVVDDSDNNCCDGCYFFGMGDCHLFRCMSAIRNDGREVRFEKLDSYE